MEKQTGDTRGQPPSINDTNRAEEQRQLGYHKRILLVGGCFATLAVIPGVVTSAVTASQMGSDRQIRAMMLGSLIFAAAGFVLGVAIMCLVAPRAFLTGPVGRPWMKLIGTKSVLVARIACLLLGLVVTLILVGVWIGFLNKSHQTGQFTATRGDHREVIRWVCQRLSHDR